MRLTGIMDREYAIHVLKLPSVFKLEHLRTNYKRMALLLHPDRRALNTESANQLFSILTDSYKLLKSEFESGSQDRDKDWMMMREESTGVASPTASSSVDFNLNSFNTTFADTRLGDENDRGYSSWMQRLKPDVAGEHQKRRQEGDRKRAAASVASNTVVLYEPEALLSSTSIPHSDLGTSRVKDFGRNLDVVGRRINLGYTDYKVAHMTASCLIDPETVQARKEFTSVAEYERVRGESSTMTCEERAAIKKHEEMLELREGRRLNAVRHRDDLVSRHHAKIHAGALT